MVSISMKTSSSSASSTPGIMAVRRSPTPGRRSSRSRVILRTTLSVPSGFNADGLLKTRDDVKHMRFRTIDEEFWEPAHKFLDAKGDYAACAMLWLGIDPTWHSMGFEHFAMSLITDPSLVGEFLGRMKD